MAILVPEQPLEDACLRVERAEEHIRDLDSRIRVYVEADRQLDFTQFDPQKMKEIFSGLSPIPPLFYILIGEISYNLRTALDYLVFTVARIDSGKPQDGTQFPIEDSPEGFGKRVKGKRGVYLIGLNACHIQMVEKLQPYQGCYWTWRLRELSNRDKHRHLTILGQTFHYDPNRPTDPLSRSEDDVNKKSVVSRNVAFWDFLPVIPTLEKLKAGVAQTLVDFKATL
jgi:hypothetical protein